ncbi:MAG: LLM class flavin-dependent oxidoreductase [Chloroflexi bacterium]|nr:MAG: LLM class flavin-dependent oxidoreductase [Chloroflexota bacterium]
MKFGMSLPNFGAFSDLDLLTTMAQEAEAAGWDGFFIWDHINRRVVQDVIDPWIALTAITLRTTTIRLGAMVTPVARRRPWKLARETVTLDHLSNGRLIFGAGLGTTSPYEWGNFGEETDIKRRAQMFDEALAILDGLWSGERFNFDGAHYQVRDTIFRPTALQQPRIPIWIAGVWPNKAPFRRAARWDGVIPIVPNGYDPHEAMRDIIALIDAQRRNTAPYDVAFMATPGTGDVSIMDDIGVTWWVDQIEPPYFNAAWEDEWPVDAMRAYIRRGTPR